MNLAREALDEAAALPSGRQPVVQLVRARLALALQQPAAARELLAEVERAWSGGDERRMLRRLRLVQAQALPPEQALPLLDQAVQAPTLAASAGAALPLQVRLAQVCLALGDAARAHRAADRAADWLLAVHPLEMSPAEVWLITDEVRPHSPSRGSAAVAQTDALCRAQESKTPLGVMPAETELKPEELLRAFKQANPKVWAIKDEQVCRKFPVLPSLLVMHQR